MSDHGSLFYKKFQVTTSKFPGRLARMLIRTEKENDKDAVRAVNRSAFETPAEADLVDSLREQAQSIVSFVAEDGGRVLGYILFSPVSLPAHPDLKVMGLGPMAVVREHQRQGIGSALVRAGLEKCRQKGVAAVVVLGHPEFYPRFGFLSSSRFGIDSEYEVQQDAFMVMELQLGSLSGKTGTVKYNDAFSNLE